MFDLAYIKRRLGWYGAAWVVGFLVSGAGVLIASLFADLIQGADLILPTMLAAMVLALGVGLVLALISKETVGTKLALILLALILLLPLMWAPVSAAVAIAFFAERSIEYSQTYAAFQIGVSELLFPLETFVRSGAIFGGVWAAFQVLASIIGFFSALANIWPAIRRVLGAEPTAA